MTTHAPAAHSNASATIDPLDRLSQAIAHAAQYLPAQGPITVFIHHNTLHAFEHLPFDDGVQQGGELFGCEPYLSEEHYLQELARGRIRVDDLAAVLRESLGSAADEPILTFGSRLELRLALLVEPPRNAPRPELHWYVAESDALAHFAPSTPPEIRAKFLRETQRWIMRDVVDGASEDEQQPASQSIGSARKALADLLAKFDRATIESWTEDNWGQFSLQALWRVCRRGVHGIAAPRAELAPPLRARDSLLAATGYDIDQPINELLIRFCAAFLDQGFSSWPLPEREQGMFHSFCALYDRSTGSPEPWLKGLPAELQRLQTAGVGPLQSIAESLGLLGVRETETEAYLTQSLLALRGWAGMIQQVEIRADSVARPILPGSLIEYLALRLILERLALKHAAATILRVDVPLDQIRAVAAQRIKRPDSAVVERRAFLIFQAGRTLGWLPEKLFGLSKAEWRQLVDEIEAFNSIERRRTLHAAYERRYRTLALDAITVKANAGNIKPAQPRFQVICCLDEREESFRRHLEEQSSLVETFGAAGFFNIAMYYRGIADAHFVPLCPVVVRPQHWVTEDVADTLGDANRRRSNFRRMMGIASHQVHLGSRTITGGAVLSGGLGAFASLPMVARVLFPRWAASLRQRASQLVRPPSLTQLQLERKSGTPGPDDDHCGFTVDEMVNIGERLLRDIGLTSNFARVVLSLGHGSGSVNNPHLSAYNCGACGGGAGGPNARALAQMLNDTRVRERLAQRGIAVPDDTLFVGGLHNTCNDSVTLLSLESAPRSHRIDLIDLQVLLDEACNRNAHERCRRFQSAPLSLSFAAARRHVEGRGEDLAQVRPELGHATNSVCFVGRRERVRGLFMDRRTFLVSYDPLQDNDEAAVLTRIMQAVTPVCAGINLEYYCSRVDSQGYGCGTKLPHNVTSLLGVMDGAASDLRTGLPWQMVEIHEPMRLLFVLENTPEAVLKMMHRCEGIGRFCLNGWVQVAVLDPHSSAIQVLRNGCFEPYTPSETSLPRAKSSFDWYRNSRDHLGFALVGN